MGHFSAKNVFTILFRILDVVQISCLDKGMTINHHLFIKDCLEHFVCTYRRQDQSVVPKF